MLKDVLTTIRFLRTLNIAVIRQHSELKGELYALTAHLTEVLAKIAQNDSDGKVRALRQNISKASRKQRSSTANDVNPQELGRRLSKRRPPKEARLPGAGVFKLDRSRNVSDNELISYLSQQLFSSFWTETGFEDQFVREIEKPTFVARVLEIVGRGDGKARTPTENQYAWCGCLWLHLQWQAYSGRKTTTGGATYQYFANDMNLESGQRLGRAMRVGRRINQLGKYGFLFCKDIALLRSGPSVVWNNFTVGPLHLNGEDVQAHSTKLQSLQETANTFVEHFSKHALLYLSHTQGQRDTHRSVTVAKDAYAGGNVPSTRTAISIDVSCDTAPTQANSQGQSTSGDLAPTARSAARDVREEMYNVAGVCRTSNLVWDHMVELCSAASVCEVPSQLLECLNNVCLAVSTCKNCSTDNCSTTDCLIQLYNVASICQIDVSLGDSLNRLYNVAPVCTMAQYSPSQYPAQCAYTTAAPDLTRMRSDTIQH